MTVLDKIRCMPNILVCSQFELTFVPSYRTPIQIAQNESNEPLESLALMACAFRLYEDGLAVRFYENEDLDVHREVAAKRDLYISGVVLNKTATKRLPSFDQLFFEGTIVEMIGAAGDAESQPLQVTVWFPRKWSVRSPAAALGQYGARPRAL